MQGVSRFAPQRRDDDSGGAGASGADNGVYFCMTMVVYVDFKFITPRKLRNCIETNTDIRNTFRNVLSYFVTIIVFSKTKRIVIRIILAICFYFRVKLGQKHRCCLHVELHR